MNVYFIAIGGSVMHNLAIALKQKGYTVNGSDDEITEPARSNLERFGLLPAKTGWDASRIQPGIDRVVLGMHARNDNPELQKARELGLPVSSFPEFLYEQSADKQRIVIAGSHGKTSITAMIMHIFKKRGVRFDYMVGSAVRGFDLTVQLTEDAPVMVLEGDEYPDSAIGQVPKFHLYRPHLALISGIAWDHINVFPTRENYIRQFEQFADRIQPGGQLVFNAEDDTVARIAAQAPASIQKIPYCTPVYEIHDGITFLHYAGHSFRLKIFGKHNMQNLMGAVSVCRAYRLSEPECYEALTDFHGAARRLEPLASGENTLLFRDFAHAPSKLKATIAAVKEQYPERCLIAIFELHTYSSLHKDFLQEYRHSMQQADIKVVYCDRHTFELKRMEPLAADWIRQMFDEETLHVFRTAMELKQFLDSVSMDHSVLLMMSSGSFGGLNWSDLSKFVTAHNVDGT